MNTSTNIVESLGQKTKAAAQELSRTDITTIHSALSTIAQSLRDETQPIMDANAQDLAHAAEKKLSTALTDRLTLTPERISAIAKGVEAIITLDDPVGNVLEKTTRPNGLIIEKTSVPIGVLGMIYESRPNVTVDAAALCLKSRNGVILRGGSDSFYSSRHLHALIQRALTAHNIPKDCISMLPSNDRSLVDGMLHAHKYIDVMIPRGGKGLTGKVMSEAKMPVFAHLDGNCHIYIHHSADLALTLDVLHNAKMRRTGICGATESLLLDTRLTDNTANDILTHLLNAGCHIVGDERTCALDPRITPATNADWSTEYLEAKISCKYVANTAAAIDHINHYGSHHTDAILAQDNNAVTAFLNQVDSAIVMHNTSTQFADGGEFGMGAEIGIGTGKLHARGPVGLRQLTTYKYIVKGNGQTRPT